MKKKKSEHILSIIFIFIIFSAAFILVEPTDYKSKYFPSNIETLAQIPGVNFDDPLQREIFKETVSIYYPNKTGKADSLLQQIDEFRQEQTLENIRKNKQSQNFSSLKSGRIIFIYLKFFLVYLLVLIFTYYAVQSLAVLKFVKMKQERSSFLVLLKNHLFGWNNITDKRSITSYFFTAFTLLLKSAGKGLAYFILFSPAYVIAYSFKTRFDTNSVFFMILLGVISNGLLITYTQKFYTFLIYIQTCR